MNELKQKLAALGLSEEMADKAIATIAEFAKSKLPANVHPMIDSVLAGESPDLGGAGGLGGILGGLKGMFGGK
jgi:hypothetical protein